MFKKKSLKTLFFFSAFTLLCMTPTKAFANDISSTKNINNSVDIVTYEKEANDQDKEFVKLRNSLVSKYGQKKAYVMLGFVPVEKKVIPLQDDASTTNLGSSYLPMSGDPATGSDSNYTTVPYKCVLTITNYKNFTSNFMDIWYEVQYTDDTSGVGAKTYGDVFASSFNTSNVYKVSTSYSANIQDYVPYSCGGTGTIKGGQIYSRMVFTVKPRYSGVNVSGIYEETNLEFGKRESNLGDGFSFSVQVGYIGISISSPKMTKYSVGLTY